MRFNIVSTDARYSLVCDLLNEIGYEAKVCTVNSCDDCDVLILSVRNELSDIELSLLFSKVRKDTLILCGNKENAERHFKGKIIDYSQREDFLLKNAYLTAEGTISYLHQITKESLKNKNVFVCGYGRIGKELCKLLRSFGCNVYGYARRVEVIKQMECDGVHYKPIEKSYECEIIINTVPCNIFTNGITKKFSKGNYVVELASYPYGFENMDNINLASGIPGKILPVSAANVIFDTIISILSTEERDKQ